MRTLPDLTFSSARTAIDVAEASEIARMARTGDLVMITASRRVALLDLPASERLDSTLGLRAIPRVPLGRRTGLFLLVLRPVEFSANPIAAYPTSVSGPRQIEDADVIEASAI